MELLGAVRYLLDEGLTLTWIRRAVDLDRLNAELRGLATRLSTLASALEATRRES